VNAGGGLGGRSDPLQEPKRQFHISFTPGSQGHGPAWVVEGLAAVPDKNLRISLLAIAGQAGGHAVFGDAGPAATAGVHVIDRFRPLPAIDAAMVRQIVQGLAPSAHSQLRAEVFKKHPIPQRHACFAIEETLTVLSRCHCVLDCTSMAWPRRLSRCGWAPPA
jgi:hypothetical protein